MSFINKPLKTLQANVTSVVGVSSMPWYNPLSFPVQPGQTQPSPIDIDYKWQVTMDVTDQQHSSYLTRYPGKYTAQDVTVGQWIANVTTGEAWRIMSVVSKIGTTVIIDVQDIYRYNTFRDQTQTGNGAPDQGVYVIFNINDEGIPLIDPVTASGTSAYFTMNLMSRFEYLNLQYDYPLYQSGNTFAIGDIIAVDSSAHSYVLASSTYNTVIGRITSISDTIPGWFTINPVRKIIDNLDSLPGNIGDIIYTDGAVVPNLSTNSSGTPIYIKLQNNSQSVSNNTGTGPSTAGYIVALNGTNITLQAPADMNSFVTSVNTISSTTGVSAALLLKPTSVNSISSLLSSYGEPALAVSSPYPTATINGVTVTFNISSLVPGYTGYARAADMAQVINNANIPGIAASTPVDTELLLTNTQGGAITIVNGHPDSAGIYFAGPSSGSGLALNTNASTTNYMQFTAIDARAINFLDIFGTATIDFGLVSVENGDKAVGLFVEEGLRSSSSTVVSNLSQMLLLSPMVGDQAYVLDSNDGNGNNVGLWSLWLYNGSTWIQISNQDSATTDAKSLEYTITTTTTTSVNIGSISTGRRVSLITVEVITAFDALATLEIGYSINNPTTPTSVPNGLMDASLIDLSIVDTYTTSTDILFGTDTPQGDVTVTANFSNGNSAQGEAKIIISYI